MSPRIHFKNSLLFHTLRATLVAVIILITMFALFGCATSADMVDQATHEGDLSTVGPAKNGYVFKDDRYSVDSIQPHAGGDLTEYGISFAGPGPHNLAGFSTPDGTKFFMSNPTASNLKGFTATYTSTDGMTHTISIDEYSNDAAAPINAESNRLTTITAYYQAATETQRALFNAEVERQLGLGEEYTSALEAAFPLLLQLVTP